jgi:hypothetical protein
MRFFMVEVLAWIGAICLITMWMALGEYLFPEVSLSKVAFMWGPAVLFLADLVYVALKTKDD